MLGRSWLAICMHSNSLIKNLTSFEDDAEIRLLNFLMWSICTGDSFIKMASLKIDFYFEVFKQLKKPMFWFTSQKQHSLKTLEFTRTNSYFYSFTYEKNILVSPSYQRVNFFRNLSMSDIKAVDSTPKYSLLTWDKNGASIFSPCIRYKWVNRIDWWT